MMNDSQPNASERQEFILKEFTRLFHGLLDQTLKYSIIQELYRHHFLYKYRDAIPRIIDGHLRDLIYSTDDQQQASAINYNQQTVTPMNNKIRQKMTQLIADFDVQRLENVLKRLGIQLMDISNEEDCIILRSMLVQCLCFYSNNRVDKLSIINWILYKHFKLFMSKVYAY